MEDTHWKLIYNSFDPTEESLREALCTLGNGYFSTRGAAYESEASRIHYPGMYLAGGYNKLATHIAGRTVYNEDLVNFPNWIYLTFKISDGEWFSPSRSRLLFYRQELDMRRGVLERRIRFQNRLGQKTVVETVRIVHMENPHIGAVRYIITPENYSDYITVRTMLDGAVINAGVERYRQLNSKHLVPLTLGNFSHSGMYLSMRTSQSKIQIAEAAKTRVFLNGKEKRPYIKHLSKGRERINQIFRIFVPQGSSLVIEKIVSVYTSKDEGVKNPLTEAIDSVKRAPGFERLYQSHIQVWDELWKKVDIRIEADSFSQKVLRLHMFHLLQTASHHNTAIDAGLPARGLHGEAYRGHIFWDSIFTMPFYDLHFPEISRALLLYRYRRLSAARRYAQKNGYRGAMFPWQSGSAGVEETQVLHLNPLSGEWGPDYSRYQRHVSFAIAYNVWQYYVRTQDLDFLVNYGAEILLSIAQFASSLVEYNPEDGRYHTRKVMGPDEFHEKYPWSQEPGLKDNAYTNFMIVWTLLRAKEALSLLTERDKRRIVKKIKLNEEELDIWDDITRKMKIIINEEGIIEQFQDYFKLKELDWDKYRERYENVERMDRILKAEGKSPDEYKVTKQADVLMIFYLVPLQEVEDIFSRLGYHCDREMLENNYKYYVKRTSHGSSLSKVVHCYIAHILGKDKDTWSWFQEVLESDIFDTQGGTTPEGIHCGVMGGSIDIVIRGFAGIDILRDRIKVAPRIPRRWQSIKLRINCRGSWITFSVSNTQIMIFIQGKKSQTFSLPLEINNKLYYLLEGKKYKFRI